MENKFVVFLFLLFLSFTLCCNNNNKVVDYTDNRSLPAPILSAGQQPFELTEEWKNYWYDGNAEINTYHLNQSRYGEMHQGNLTTIFVTEDFSATKQVKLDDGAKDGSDKISILKFNEAVKFVTGIYPYSLMLSTFSPVDINNYPHAIKVTASSQEWCGNAFFQLNNRSNRFLVEQRSYFEKENDQDISLEPVMLEDECWNIIRLDPEKLPQGDQKILPGALYLRLSHKEMAPVRATCKLLLTDTGYVYTILFPSLQRTWHISFEKVFPYKITGWSDSFPGLDGKTLNTTAKLYKTRRIDYWRTHTNGDKKLRGELGLPVETQ